MEYRREIDGLRALAVIPVLFFHAGIQTFSGGFVGVDVFFVISGYIITSIILDEKKAGTFTLLNFYERRVRRILPTLLFMIFACIPFSLFYMTPGELKEFSECVIFVNMFASNILFWRTSGYFETSAELKPLIHTWSLAVEEQFYLLFPIFLIVVWRLGKGRIISILILLFCASLVTAEWASINKPTANFFLLPTRGFEILIGTFAAFYLHSNKTIKSRSHSYKIVNVPIQPINQTISVVGLLMVLYAVFKFDKQTPMPSLFSLVPTVGAVLIILCANQKTLVGKLLGSKIFVGVGLISYSAYLWHQPLLAYFRIRSDSDIDDSSLFIILLMTLVMAFLSWKFIEVPFRNKNKISQKSLVFFSIYCSIFLVIFGIYGSYTNGLVFRYNKDDRNLASVNYSESGKYVAKKFNENMMKNFDDNDSRLKILIVGDSFAQDLVNALHEAGFEKNISISTRYIIHGCGNLFIDRDEFIEKIDKNCLKKVSGFGYEGLYEDEKFKDLMLNADEIWFASAWDYWQAGLINKSVTNATNFSKIPIKVFGRKDFGRVDIKNLLSKSHIERHFSKGIASAATIQTNELLKKSLPTDVFIDIQDLLCGSEVGFCSLFDSDGNLVSYDGAHLTLHGAKLLGNKLASGKLQKYLANK